MPLTMRDIASRCGVSRSTVSLILSGQAHRFQEAVVRKVERTVAELGYRPNRSALAVRSGRFNCLALLIGRAFYLPPDLLKALARAAARRDHHIATASFSDEQLADAATMPQWLRGVYADGAIMDYIDPMPDQANRTVEALDLPVAWMNVKRPRNAAHPDDRGGGRLAAAALIARGHRRLAVVAPEMEHYSAADRAAGVGDACADVGLRPRTVRYARQAGSGELISRLRTLFAAPDRPTAVVCYSLNEGVPAHIAAASVGLSVPADLSLITFGDRSTDLIGAPFDQLELPWGGVAEAVVEVLLARIAGAGDQPTRAVAYGPPSAGGTCAGPPSDA